MYRPNDTMKKAWGCAFWVLFTATLLIAATVARGETLTFEEQITRKERQALSMAIVANLIRRQNEEHRIPKREYIEHVPENEYPRIPEGKVDPLPSPKGRNWRVTVRDEVISNPDPWDFWATIPQTVYTMTNDAGQEVQIAIEWRQ